MNELLKLIADNQPLFDAVKSVVHSKFTENSGYNDLPPNADNELIGQITRARIEGCKKVDDAFREIANHATIKPGITKTSPHR